MQPIETQYRGYRFRSRLEARWAVFFDHGKERWRYEHEGFRLPSGFYLPDFFFPHRDGFIEVKPLHLLPVRNFQFGPDDGEFPIDDVFPREWVLAHELACSLDLASLHCVVVYGDPYDVMNFEGGAVCVAKHGLQKGIGFIDFFPASLLAAADAARGARFEYGENAR